MSGLSRLGEKESDTGVKSESKSKKEREKSAWPEPQAPQWQGAGQSVTTAGVVGEGGDMCQGEEERPKALRQLGIPLGARERLQGSLKWVREPAAARLNTNCDAMQPSNLHSPREPSKAGLNS